MNPIQKYVINKYFNKNVKPLIDKYGEYAVKRAFYDHLSPWSYYNAKKRIDKVLNHVGENPIYYSGLVNGENIVFVPERDDIFAEYLQIPQSERHIIANKTKVNDSKYKPTSSSNPNAVYKAIELPEMKKIGLVEQANGFYNANGENYRVVEQNNLESDDQTTLYFNHIPQMKLNSKKVSKLLKNYFGLHTISRGRDENGEYVSYYDLWDLAPVNTTGGNMHTYDSDQSLGFGKPIEFYDRIYLDDYYEVPEEARGYSWLPELIVTNKK